MQCLLLSRLLDFARLRITKEKEETEDIYANQSKHVSVFIPRVSFCVFKPTQKRLPLFFKQGSASSVVNTALHLLHVMIPLQNVDAATEGARALIRDRLVTLFSDDTTTNCVRRTLLQTATDLATLATFLGPSQGKDVILSHVVTFLNDKVVAW